MTIAAKPTLYADTRFRSRLEARWAVFFDALGIKWVYEPVIEGVNGYLPDFEIGTGYIEIKPQSWAPHAPDYDWEDRHFQDFQRWRDFSVHVDRSLTVCIAEPGIWVNGRLTGMDQCVVFLPTEELGYLGRWSECGVCGAIRVIKRGVAVCDCPQEFGQLKRAMRAVRDVSYSDAP